MTNKQKTNRVKLLRKEKQSRQWLEDYLAKLHAHFSRGDPWEALPWNWSELMTLEDFREWVASRKEADRKLDVEICEIARWYTWFGDPYGEELDPPEELQYATKQTFVRSPESEGWVCVRDLSDAHWKAFNARLQRERRAWEVAAGWEPVVGENEEIPF